MSDWFPKSKQPEPNRLIRCKGFDWSAFECEGMMIPYSNSHDTPKRLRGKVRFCARQRNGSFMSDKKTWLDIEKWQYAEVTSEAVVKDE